MKKALLAVLSLSIGLGIGYVIKHDTPIFLESQKHIRKNCLRFIVLY